MNLLEDIAQTMAYALDGTPDLFDGTWPHPYVAEYLDAAGVLIDKYVIYRGGHR